MVQYNKNLLVTRIKISGWIEFFIFGNRLQKTGWQLFATSCRTFCIHFAQVTWIEGNCLKIILISLCNHSQTDWRRFLNSCPLIYKSKWIFNKLQSAWAWVKLIRKTSFCNRELASTGYPLVVCKVAEHLLTIFSCECFNLSKLTHLLFNILIIFDVSWIKQMTDYFNINM